ncbi:hypothetical protein NOF04DRAFT_13489 [Fusarium oxysporum II5]|uniref:Glycosyltransferase 2-like domain-containing protein n=1 Tax=Fusarium odoratissimum (strain NRRL 54006) TaxID=1089451 RepID=X0K9X8_FUSO5|nr:uncharacterized protein FOIG_13351 [Fusarium odoratissimum NRRL 54006]EXL93784.1 hypothetical protein FOIG_13351 [Fusarium odoratissimum NRRL 54006]KAK2134086.1 hypothetical protein NOF04DRAFT_13489 [Fusarium oxysporum II5]
MTIDILLGIILTESNRFANEGRRISFYSTLQRENSPKGREANFSTQSSNVKLNCLSAVVGYREDTALFTRALESYKAARGQDFMLVGIDGNNAEDQDMVDVFQRVVSILLGVRSFTRSTPACTATSDCQSGPCTAFRLSALSAILMPWYMQKVFGKRMIVNEDRHLTTNLLVRGWAVVFASDVLTATETPTTVTRWLRQQVRWARATHIESLLIPCVYAMSHPMAFFAAARREFGPLVVAVAVLSYFLTSHKLLYFSYPDLFLRIGITTVYNLLRNPDRLRLALSWYVVPGMFFYNIPLPAIHIWSLVTMTADTWGTAMRASTEIPKKDSSRKKWFETGFFVVWMGIVGGTVSRWLANEFDLCQGQTLVFMLCGVSLASVSTWKATIASQ